MTIPVSSARRWVNAHDVVVAVLGRDAMVDGYSTSLE